MLIENLDLGSHGKLFAHWTDTSKALLRGEVPPVFKLKKRRRDDIHEGPFDNIVAGVAWLRQNAGLLRGKVVEPAFPNMDAKEQQELLERIRSSTDAEEKYPLLFTFDFQEDMEVFLNMAAEEDLRVNAMFLGRWVDSQ
ncbi:unnamed protein product [Arctogadus glacialis]